MISLEFLTMIHASEEYKILRLFSKILISTLFFSLIQLLLYPEPFNPLTDAISWLSGVESMRLRIDNLGGMIIGFCIYLVNITLLLQYLFNSSKENLFYNSVCILLIPFYILSAFPHDINNYCHVWGILAMLLTLAILLTRILMLIPKKNPNAIKSGISSMWGVGIYYIFAYFNKYPFYQFIQKIVIIMLIINLGMLWFEIKRIK
jgi:hypothetical protein